MQTFFLRFMQNTSFGNLCLLDTVCTSTPTSSSRFPLSKDPASSWLPVPFIGFRLFILREGGSLLYLESLPFFVVDVWNSFRSTAIIFSICSPLLSLRSKKLPFDLLLASSWLFP